MTRGGTQRARQRAVYWALNGAVAAGLLIFALRGWL